MSILFVNWRGSLQSFLSWFENLRTKTRYFYIKTFAVFVVINLGCFWWALLTTYPNLLVGPKAEEYVLIGFPVAILGAVFDSLSLLVTLVIIKRALASTNNFSYLGYLSIDLLIAVLATFWVLFAFMVSGWLVSFVLAIPETIESRALLFEGRLTSIWIDPFSSKNLKNIYFGTIMGASALLPTLFHAFLAVGSLVRSVVRKFIPKKLEPGSDSSLLWRGPSQRQSWKKIVLRQSVTELIFWAAALAVGILSLTSRVMLFEVAMYDKLQHFAAYGALLFLGWIAYSAKSTRLWIIFGLIVYGAMLEVLQSFVPGRYVSLEDVAANSLGVFLGAFCFLTAARIHGSFQKSNSHG